MAYSTQILAFQARMAKIPEAVREAIKPSLAKSADELATMVKYLAEPSKHSGALIDSVAITGPGETTPAYSQPGGATVVPENAVVVTVGNDAVRYAHLVEFGTVKSAPHAFFWPAFRLLKTRIANRTKRDLRKALKNWEAGQ